MPSVFTKRPPSERVASNALAFAIRDAFPVSPGHTLVVPVREVETWFEATAEEKQAILDLVDVVKRQLDGELHPHGYNVGFNAGTAAGQTVMHLHVHVIPRFEGDVPDPRGGVRHVIPGRGNYLVAAGSPLVTGGLADPFLAHIRPLFLHATRVSIVAAFVQDSGLDLIHDDIASLLGRGGRVRLVTGDYLAITQVSALERLLGWTAIWSTAASAEGEPPSRPSFEARVVETARLSPPGSSFHPKCWIFDGPDLGVAFVGSSNLSRSALSTGIEWNLRTERASAPAAWTDLDRSFEALWSLATPLSAEWLAGYEERALREVRPLPPGEEHGDPELPFPEPHAIQTDGLGALRQVRGEGRGRTLAVMATGLGKTWLAAFDVLAWTRENGRFPKVLFVAHRAEILEQAAATFARMARHIEVAPRISWYVASSDGFGGDLTFASVQKLARAEGLQRLDSERFDYAIVDEVHHATAESYRRILDRLNASFVLGLTATPDRADAGDVRGLFDDHVAFEARLDRGIDEGLLSPFAYWGLRDTIDYADIPWRNRRFDTEALATAAATTARMDRLWEAWQVHPGLMTIVFCCSKRHAAFTEGWLVERGVRCRTVTADTSPGDRAGALAALRAGELDALCAVDILNEGVDIPGIDRVVMLRPTESPVLFLQQLGRGLRRMAGKEQLTVIDFVGNHRVFLERVHLLLSLSRRPISLREFLEAGVSPDLPAGCSVDVELEAIELLSRLLPRGESEVVRAYREMRLVLGRRPTAGELYRSGYLPSALKGWFPFVAREGDLTGEERLVHGTAAEWLDSLERTPMSKAFKMVVLEVLLEEDAVSEGMDLSRLAQRAHEYIVRSPELRRDISDVARFDDPFHPDPAAWLSYWNENPVRAWTEGRDGRWFRVAGDRFVPRLPIPEGGRGAFAAMTRELVDYRLAQYRRRVEAGAPVLSFSCKVISNQRDPILKLPSRTTRPDVPTGEVDVRISDGSVWRFRFAKEFCNVARPAGKDRNELPDLLRTWLGPSAGRPGTAFQVTFRASPDGLWVEPAQQQVLSFPSRTRVPCYPSLRAAAGAARPDSFDDFQGADGEVDEVRLPIARPGDRLFAVRASGSSMDGGRDPIRDGDWVVLRWARGEALKNVAGKIALVETSESSGPAAYQLKRVVREAGRWLLRSDNPDVPDFEAPEEALPLALHVQTVRPEELAPPVGTMIPDAGLAEAFGLDEAPRNGRTNGHLFLMVEAPGSLVAPDRLADTTVRSPGETAFLLTRAKPGSSWRYAGVGRWVEGEGLWQLPEVDWPTWRTLGKGRQASRRLPPGMLEEATAAVQRILELARTNDGLVSPGDSIRVLGPAPGGGLRIDGGPGAFKERTVSLLDIAWVLVARRIVEHDGGVLDEPRVNRVRYLEGTPRESTRWIDTRHAIALLAGPYPEIDHYRN